MPFRLMLTLPKSSFNFLQTYDKGYEFFSYKNWHEHLENVYIGWLRRSKMAEITFRKWIRACRKHLKIGRECDKCDIDKTTSDSFLTLNSSDAMLEVFCAKLSDLRLMVSVLHHKVQRNQFRMEVWLKPIVSLKRFLRARLNSSLSVSLP